VRKLKLKVVHETKTGAVIQAGGSNTFLSKFSPLYEVLRTIIEEEIKEETLEEEDNG
jgi:hypothetical protein